MSEISELVKDTYRWAKQRDVHCIWTEADWKAEADRLLRGEKDG